VRDGRRYISIPRPQIIDNLCLGDGIQRCQRFVQEKDHNAATAWM
jgi:hypothetical protein